ncbi:hypothetical protein FXO37_08527 [Capsicum annuum]|nr:hypothetical protein FXO37_08527 [Capsicum annuum]
MKNLSKTLLKSSKSKEEEYEVDSQSSFRDNVQSSFIENEDALGSKSEKGFQDASKSSSELSSSSVSHHFEEGAT